MIIPNKGLRILNFIIDLIAIVIINGVITNLIPLINQPEITIYLCFFFYYLLFESVNGRTIGKLITNTKVIDRSYSKPGFWRIFLRTIMRLNPFDWMSYPFGFGNGAHDQLSGTKTVIAKSQSKTL